MCKLQHTSFQVVESDDVFGYYFFCDLRQTITNFTDEYNTDYLVMDVHTKSNRTIGLEAVFVGETYKKMIQKTFAPDCGKLEVKKTGVLEQVELGYIQVSCNDSFTEAGGIVKYVQKSLV